MAETTYTTDEVELNSILQKAMSRKDGGRKLLAICCNNSARNKFCQVAAKVARLRLDILIMDEAHFLRQKEMLAAVEDPAFFDRVTLFQAYSATPNRILREMCGEPVVRFTYRQAVEAEVIRWTGSERYRKEKDPQNPHTIFVVFSQHLVFSHVVCWCTWGTRRWGTRRGALDVGGVFLSML